MRLLVVCHANVARSVAAAHLLAGSVDERGVTVEVRTAGTHALSGQPVSQRTTAALAAALRAPVSLAGHRARPLDDADVEWADLVVTMEAAQVRSLRRSHPDAAPRCATLGLLARQLPHDRRAVGVRVAELHLEAIVPADDDDVEDPAGGDDDDYARTMATLVARCHELAERLAG